MARSLSILLLCGILLLCSIPGMMAVVTVRVGHRVLILTNDNGGQDAPEHTFNGYEIPWDTISVPQTGYSGNIPLFNADGSPKYALILLTSSSLAYYNSASGLYESALTAAQWSYIEDYERAYSIRRIVLNDYPTPSEGTLALGGTSEVQAITIAPEFAGLAKLKSSGSLDTTGLYHSGAK
ncbi:hypothetical protein HDU93_003736 [Gonapodya sp. JEL0774]|nr:hypothetical protein HDU93_003736 [Gonapodya sp. JEL0774]